MKVLLVNIGFVPQVGGSYRTLYEMARRFPRGTTTVLTSYGIDAREFDTGQELPVIRSNVYSLLDKGGAISWHDSIKTLRDVPVVQPLIRTKIFTVIGMLLALARTMWELLRTNYDFVLAGQAWTTGWTAWLSKKMTGIPYGTFVYGEDVSLLKHKVGVLGWLFLRSVRNADWVIAISKPTAKLLLDFGIDPRKIVVQSPAVDTSLFAPEKKPTDITDQYGLHNRRVILSVGRLIPRKGFDNVVRALPKVKERFPDVIYLIRGDGPEKDNILRAAEDVGVADCVRFVDAMAYEKLPGLYNVCDVFVMPNRIISNTGEQEGFGIVFIEASSCGKPVIGGSTGGSVEAIVDGQTGFLVDPTEPEQVAEKILQLLADTKLAADVGQKGRRFVESNFSWESFSETIWKLIVRANENQAGIPGSIGIVESIE